MEKTTILLFLLFLSRWAVESVQGDVTFNTSAPCMQSINERICYFNDTNIWNGGNTPISTDNVIIQSDSVVTIILNSATNIYGITISGNVFFELENVQMLVTTNFTWYAPVLVSLSSGSFCTANFASGSNFTLLDSVVKVKTGTSLSFANITQSTLSSPTFNVSTLEISGENSQITSGRFTVDNLYSYGDVSFSSISVRSSALFEDNSNLQLIALNTLLPYANIEFKNCETSITKASLSANTNITFASTEEEVVNSHVITTLTCPQVGCLLILESVNITLYSASFVTPVVGENVLINIRRSYQVGTVSFPYLRTTEAPVQIISDTSLEFQKAASFAANIVLQGDYAQLLVSSVLKIEPTCSISGAGQLVVDGGILFCDGKIDVANIVLKSANITVEELSFGQLQVSPTLYGNLQRVSFIIGNVDVVNGSIFFGSSPLTVVGNYEHTHGAMAVSFSKIPSLPVLTVTEEVKISKVDLTVQIHDGFEGKLLLVQGTEEISASFNSFKDLQSPKHKLAAHVSEGRVFVQTAKEGDIEWIHENWIYFIVFAIIIGVLSLILGCSMSRLAKLKRLPEPGDTIISYVRSLSFSPLSCCEIIFLFVFYIFVWLALVESAILTLLLALLIPLGFIFGIIEHKFIMLWGLIVLFIQVGGMLDIFADLLLMAKVSIYYIQHSSGSNEKTSLDYLEGQELQLWAARLGFTIFSSFFGVQLLFSLRAKKGLGGILNRMSNSEVFGSDDSSQMRGGGAWGVFFQIVLSVIFWKVLMLGMRVYLLGVVLRSLLTKRRLGESAQKKIQWLESVLYVDLMWSGIPLGILTFLELFYFSEDFEFGKDQIFELMKLGALAVDMVGASFLFYFIILGLNKKLPILHHHQHHTVLKRPLLGNLQDYEH